LILFEFVSPFSAPLYLAQEAISFLFRLLSMMRNYAERFLPLFVKVTAEKNRGKNYYD
jgi:hypothetical protein